MLSTLLLVVLLCCLTGFMYSFTHVKLPFVRNAKSMKSNLVIHATNDATEYWQGDWVCADCGK